MGFSLKATLLILKEVLFLSHHFLHRRHLNHHKFNVNFDHLQDHLALLVDNMAYFSIVSKTIKPRFAYSPLPASLLCGNIDLRF